MPHVELLLSTSGFFIFFSAVVAVALSIFAYRHTVPVVPQAKRYLLVGLRTLALFFLMLLFLEPILRLVRVERKSPTIAILVDDSKSMSLTDRTGNRSEIARAILKSNGIQKLSELGRTELFGFSSDLRAISTPDSLQFNSGVTDISTALRDVQEKSDDENIQAVVLVTDGDYNLGENPLRQADRFGMPIYTIGIGDSSEQKDVLVTKVITNEIAYAESRIPMDVTVKSSGFNGERVEVSLSEERKTIAQQFLTLKEGTWEYPVKFSFEPKEEGTRKYTVTVSRLEGELTAANNSKSAFVKVLKSKMRALLLAGAPSTDVAFIRRALTEDKNVDLKVLVQKSATEFYEGAFSASMITDFDCILLVGFPLTDSRDDVLRALQLEIQQRNKPLLFIMSKDVDLTKLGALESILPFTVGPRSASEILVSLQVPQKEQVNPIMNLNGSPSLWDNLPPIYKTETVFRAKPEAEILGLEKVRGVSVEVVDANSGPVKGRTTIVHRERSPLADNT
jgi:hypothetical protein